MNSETKKCQNCSKEFTIEPEDSTFYNRIHVPSPTRCPECRMVRRFVFRNNRHLFRRKDDASGKDILSGFPRDVPLKVYERDYWWSDAWDPMAYGREYDFSRPFLEQFRELLFVVPVPSKSTERIVNSDYCDQAGDLKNCYLCFDADGLENCTYVVKATHTKDGLDLYEAMHDELCYDSVMIDSCYHTLFSFDCENCNDVWFSKDLTGCTNCFGCVNLRNKSYYIFNQPYTKEGYREKLKEFRLGSFQALKASREEASSFWLKFPVKYMHAVQNLNASGEHIQNSKNIQRSYSIHDGQEMKYCQLLYDRVTDAYDWSSFGIDSSRIYECVTCGIQSYGLKFCWECWIDVQELEYSAFCHSSSNLFGCVALYKKQYCIFNKQYSKEDYFLLREKIIKHMNEMPYTDKRGRVYGYGEFFPPEFSPFAYNETMAQDFFPLTKEEAENRGYLWREPEAREYQTTVNAADLPDHINDIQDAILKEIIKCASCAKAYRIIPMELDFLRRMFLPLPRLCPNCRFLERFKFVNPPKFWHAQCQCAGPSDNRGIYQNTAPHFHGQNHCLNEFETSYAPERPEIVYCEQCYQNEVV